MKTGYTFAEQLLRWLLMCGAVGMAVYGVFADAWVVLILCIPVFFIGLKLPRTLYKRKYLKWLTRTPAPDSRLTKEGKRKLRRAALRDRIISIVAGLAFVAGLIVWLVGLYYGSGFDHTLGLALMAVGFVVVAIMAIFIKERPFFPHHH